jgi:hypothetical protein
VTVEDLAKRIQDELGESWIPRIYRDRILKLRTRSYNFDHVKPAGRIAIQHTLLGIELKIGRKRLLCPDLATARYLSVFARAGCQEVAIPYDITKISLFADELESSWFRMLLLADECSTSRTRLRALLFANIRAEILAAGPGTKIPEFRQSTRQR